MGRNGFVSLWMLDANTIAESFRLQSALLGLRHWPATIGCEYALNE